MSWATAVFLMVLIWGGVTVWSRRQACGQLSES